MLYSSQTFCKVLIFLKFAEDYIACLDKYTPLSLGLNKQKY